MYNRSSEIFVKSLFEKRMWQLRDYPTEVKLDEYCYQTTCL